MAENVSAPREIYEDGKVDVKLTKAILVSIDKKIKQYAEKLEAPGSIKEVSIYKVPQKLRELNEGAYTPRCVSIGPLHRDDKRLVGMRSQKVICMGSLFRRIADESNPAERGAAYGGVMKNCIEAMLEMEADAQSCYAESVELRHSDFAEMMLIDAKSEENIPHPHFAVMMLVDGCFILEHIYRSLAGYKNRDDPIFGNRLVWFDVRHDLLLLENQIPYFVLEKLFQLTVDKIQHRPEKLRNLSLTEFIIIFFGNMMNFKSPIPKKKHVTGDHILGLLHNCYLPSSKIKNLATEDDEAGLERDLEANGEKANMKCNTSSWFSQLCGLKCDTSCLLSQLCDGNSSQEDHGIFKHTATELDLAGVNLHAASKEHVLDMKFTTSCWFSGLWLCNMCGKTTFSLAPICIQDSTEPFLRNLIAFEQCSPRIELHVTSYAFLMDTLIDNEKDVELLEKARVLQNQLGASEDASKLFNNICKEVFLGDQFFFKKQWKQVDEHCNRCWPKNIASLRHKYFTNPWASITFIAALYTFGLSIFSLYNTLREY